METRRWTNPAQPQTLQVAVFLLYANAVVAVIFGGIWHPLGFLLAVGGVAAGFGIANEQRWGYALGLAVALMPFAFIIFLGMPVRPIGLLFDIALVALLVHPQSRDYQRIWFS